MSSKRTIKEIRDEANFSIENKRNNPMPGKSKINKYRKFIITGLILSSLSIMGIFIVNNAINRDSSNALNNQEQDMAEESQGTGSNNFGAGEPTLSQEFIHQQIAEQNLQKEEMKKVMELIEKADLLAMGYYYDEAIKLIKDYEGGYKNYEELQEAMDGYEAVKATLDPFGAYESVDQISHIFFHSLIADNSLAFDGDSDSNGYNYYMTTIYEFKQMMQQMYDAGYVLVSIHDVGKKITTDEGTTKFIPGDIMLPPDKKPFVLSQDDVNYYDYMDYDGFASRMVVDENGRPSTEMRMEDGTVLVGDYDMVPVLETFIEEHPDFSFQGARGILALTGYEGALGYRTDDKNSQTYEQDKETVRHVAKVLKEWGWEFASHSYGHRNMLEMSTNFIIMDTNRWMEEVGSLIGPTDIFIYPYGIEIEKTLGTYSNDKYNYLKSLGFEYYCGVYKDPWIHIKDEYVRMTRRPLDGQALLQFPERLSDLFDVLKVIDPDRPALK
ncbi:MAG: hypothetical protein K0R92_1105 [Lachnospiraceae bacterium]|jgi:hypothetical protein|nr:hypothetical protein [Lachnospiraceae bacterium]